MDIIRLRESNCRNCYKCIRECPVKSISYENEQARIIDSDCIHCGHCLLICPQNAKYVASDLPQLTDALKKGEKIYVTVAPSYVAAWPDISFANMSAALTKLGFAYAEETAIGAERVTREYEKLMREHNMKNIIATACPAIVRLVEKYYPELIDQLAPVASPAHAHARLMRRVYGKNIKIAFIGPCIAKKAEFADPLTEGVIDFVLTFDELADMMEKAKVSFSEEQADCPEIHATKPRFYPVPGGILRNIGKEEREYYECVALEGTDRCKEVLASLKAGELSGYFLEMNACLGGCVGGPILKMMHLPFLSGRDAVLKNAKEKAKGAMPPTEGYNMEQSRVFIDRSNEKPLPTEEEIRAILLQTGKTSPDKELNCGSCGYPTCREKAIAVYYGKADVKMCLPFMREQAESMSNAVFEHTPNGIVILDEELCIRQMNPAAMALLKAENADTKGLPLDMFISCTGLPQVVADKSKVIKGRVRYDELGIVVDETVLSVDEHHMYLVLFTDITAEEKKRDSRMRVSEESADIAQKVIEKQMRVAQEIASLLGETTAETKLALNKLKKSMRAEIEENER